ncbi:MAG TPA: glycosyltransferase family 39 protein [Terriglobia bacterium]|nr:glycosyltransferase family 39 protein [Terriglobia bacterium]
MLLVLLTRLPLMPQHLYNFDSVNLALAMREFDPARHQPQPPGYPFFVAESRLTALLLPDPVQTFHALKILISALSLGLLYWTGRELCSERAGLAAAGLLFVHPVFWYSGLTSPLRLHAALFSLLVALFCWRALRGRPESFYAASLALGLGAGFRPTLLLTLLPLWAWCAWSTRNGKTILRGAALLAGCCALWVAPLVWAYGGLVQTWNSFLGYLLFHSQSAAALAGEPLFQWRRMIGRTVLWNGLGVVPLFFLAPFAWRAGNGQGRGLPFRFLAVWFLPPFLFNLLVHVGAPGHTLTTVPALCLAGGMLVDAVSRDKPEGTGARRAGSLWLAALLWSTVIFFWPRAVPQAAPTTAFRGWASVRDALSIGSYETSYARVRYREQKTADTLSQIRRLKSERDAPVVLIWSGNETPVWRKLAYYFPSDPVYELIGAPDRRGLAQAARRWRGNLLLASYEAAESVRLPVPVGARLIWILPPREVERLRQTAPLRSAFPVHYTDLGPSADSIRLGEFEFYPQEPESAAAEAGGETTER